MTFAEILHDIEIAAEDKIEKLKVFFDQEMLPYAESFLKMFTTHEFKVMLEAAIIAEPMIATGGFAAAVASVTEAALAAAPGIAEQDAKTTLLQAQTALQLVKNMNETQTSAPAADPAVDPATDGAGAETTDSTATS